MKAIFWLSLVSIIYTYIGYLAVLYIFSLFKGRKALPGGDYYPSVSFIIAAYNEEKGIGKKLEDSIRLDYPKDKLEIIVASDASTDRTDEIVNSFSDKGVKLVRQGTRKGKTLAQNLAVSLAKSEILVFSDATTIYKADAIRKLVRHFEDFNIGCVGGEEHFIKSDNEISEEAGFFWKYETLIRRKESDFNTMIGVSGCIFAIRRELYEPLEGTLIEDFALPLQVASKGFKVIYDAEAVGYERAAKDTKAELSRKARIVSGGINVVFMMKRLLNPLKYPILSFQIISHKILRWLSPIFMITLFISNMFLLRDGIGFLIIGAGQISFYMFAFAGYIFKAPAILRLVYHFSVINLAAIIGMARFLKGDKKVLWETVR